MKQNGRNSAVGLLWFACALAAVPAQGQLTEAVLHNFAAYPPGGSSPESAVIRDSAGNLYGTALFGGTSNYGVVYKVDPKGIETALHNFTGGADGAYPLGSLILDSAGNIYGTTTAGAIQACPSSYPPQGGCGVVFKLDPANHFTVLYTFTGKADGGSPYANLTRDGSGNLYGTTYYGGTVNSGVVFKLDSTGHETVLHSFMAGADGRNPIAGVILDSAGNLYGTTYYGGLGSHPNLFRKGCGVVYKVTPSGQETVLYSFPCNADGALPSSGSLVLDSAGNLYGSTFAGGIGLSSSGAEGYGVVYKLDPAGQETVLHRFTGGGDGGNANGSVTLDAAGNLYGTTVGGGVGYGVVYQVDPAGREGVLYNFSGGTDGANPDAGIILDAAGNLYGTTEYGGPANLGAVFKLDVAGKETVLNCFWGAPGGTGAIGGVTRDSAGNFYGVTKYGGKANAGVVYRIDAHGHETVLHSFTGGADGGVPAVSVVRDSAGNLYGVTQSGGAANAGVVYRLDTGGHQTVLRSFPYPDEFSAAVPKV